MSVKREDGVNIVGTVARPLTSVELAEVKGRRNRMKISMEVVRQYHRIAACRRQDDNDTEKQMQAR